MSHTAVRRAAVVSFAVSVFGLLTLMLVASVMLPPHSTPVSVDHNTSMNIAEEAETEQIQLPMKIACTSLIVKTMACYDGSFYEDGSGAEVVDVAALVLYNSSDTLIPYASVIVNTQTSRYTFHAYMIPPCSSVLVPEASAQQYSPGGIVNIFGWHTVKQSQTPSNVKITEQGETSLRVKNTSDQDICGLTIYFRKYVDGIYIGGKPYEITIPCLPAGKTLVVCPKYYVSGYTRIVHFE